MAQVLTKDEYEIKLLDLEYFMRTANMRALTDSEREELSKICDAINAYEDVYYPMT